MRHPHLRLLLPLLVLSAFAASPVRADPRTPNDLLSAGGPTFVAGTAGDDRADREVRAQIAMLRGMLFPDAPVLADSDIDPAKGPDAWPARPVLYGGPHVNRLVAAIADRLPFRLGAGRLEIAGRTLSGDEYRILALVPGRPPDGDRPAFPPFLLYAGCGTPGVAEINAIPHGGDGFLVADRFGELLAGTFEVLGGALAPRVTRERPRIEWQEIFDTREDAGVRVLWPAVLADRKTAWAAGVALGVKQAREALGEGAASAVSVYLYPDRRSKQSLTQNPGDGHADLLSGSVHALLPEAPGFRALVAHEAAHVLAYRALGLPGMPALGEGLAVCAAGGYGGVALDDWRRVFLWAPPLADLLSGKFRSLPENDSYPAAGLFVRALRVRAGEEVFRTRLYPATPGEFAAAAREAGLPEKDLEALYREATLAW